MFSVGESVSTFGGFWLWREGFKRARRVERPYGRAVTIHVAGLYIRVMPAPEFPAPTTD